MLALHELQQSFAAALRDRPHDVEAWASSEGIAAAARLSVYRNNSWILFEQALQLTYPVLRRRVGPDYFRQLTHQFRDAHPSHVGDLHEAGRPFAGFLAAQLAATPYAWLAELASLEWAVAEAAVAADSSVASAAPLATLGPEVLESVCFEFVPSLQRVAGTVPVLSVWRANQPGCDECVVDLSSGPEYVIVHRGATGLTLRSVTRCEYACIAALAGGATLRAAVEQSALPVEGLAGLLHWLLADAAVAVIVAPVTV